MTIKVELPPEVEALFLQRRDRGLSIDAYVKACLTYSVQVPSQPAKLSVDELNRLLDEAAEVVPKAHRYQMRR